MKDRFHELLAANGPALWRLTAGYARTHSDREDLFQEIALAIWKALPGFRELSSERTFIFRIAHHRAITHSLRRRPAASPGEGLDPPDPSPGPESGLLRAERHMRLQAAVRQLPLEFRHVITLALEGLTYSEIAVVAGISESNVGVRLNRARQMLRRMLEVKQ